MVDVIKNFIQEEEGASAIEYGLIAALVSIAIVVAAGQLGTDLTTTFEDVSTELTGS